MNTCMNNKDKNMKNFLSSQDRNIKIIITVLDICFRCYEITCDLPTIFVTYQLHKSDIPIQYNRNFIGVVY